jgi:hypothetical protein
MHFTFISQKRTQNCNFSLGQNSVVQIHETHSVDGRVRLITTKGSFRADHRSGSRGVLVSHLGTGDDLGGRWARNLAPLSQAGELNTRSRACASEDLCLQVWILSDSKSWFSFYAASANVQCLQTSLSGLCGVGCNPAYLHAPSPFLSFQGDLVQKELREHQAHLPGTIPIPLGVWGFPWEKAIIKRSLLPPLYMRSWSFVNKRH